MKYLFKKQKVVKVEKNIFNDIVEKEKDIHLFWIRTYSNYLNKYVFTCHEVTPRSGINVSKILAEEFKLYNIPTHKRFQFKKRREKYFVPIEDESAQ